MIYIYVYNMKLVILLFFCLLFFGSCFWSTAFTRRGMFFLDIISLKNATSFLVHRSKKQIILKSGSVSCTTFQVPDVHSTQYNKGLLPVV